MEAPVVPLPAGSVFESRALWAEPRDTMQKITAALKQAFAMQSSPVQKHWFVLRLACAGVWVAELFWLQQISFAAAPWVRVPIFVQFIRLYFDVIFAVAIVLLLKRRLLVAWFV